MSTIDRNYARLVAGELGRELNAERRIRGLTQAQLGRKIGLSAARVGELERGEGETAPLEVWVSLGEAIERPLAAVFSPATDALERAADSLLAAEATILGLARQYGRSIDSVSAELSTDRGRSIVLVLKDAATQSLIVVELWNLLDDVLAAVESTRRRILQVSDRAVSAGGSGPPYHVGACWLLLDRAANRRLVSESMDIIESAFPGSSARWVESLSRGSGPPPGAGLAWIDPRRHRLIPFRRRGRGYVRA